MNLDRGVVFLDIGLENGDDTEGGKYSYSRFEF